MFFVRHFFSYLGSYFFFPKDLLEVPLAEIYYNKISVFVLTELSLFYSHSRKLISGCMQSKVESLAPGGTYSTIF